MNNPKNQNNIARYVKLEDYKVFDYEIPEIFLDFVIKKNAVNVTTKLKLVKKSKNTKNLILDGRDILLKNKEISKFFNEQDLLKMIDPSNYLGAAPTMAQRLLDKRKLP